MAILPVPGHTRALFGSLLILQPSSPSFWLVKNTEQDPRGISIETILYGIWLRELGKLALQHYVSYTRF